MKLLSFAQLYCIASAIFATVCFAGPHGPDTPPPETTEAISALIGRFDAERHTLRIAPVRLPGASHTLYVELVRAGRELDPELQQFWEFVEWEGEVGARVYQIPEQRAAGLVGLWSVPEFFDKPGPEELIPLGDLRLTTEADGPRLVSLGRFPSDFDGASFVEMDISVREDEILWSRQGVDRNGLPVWGDEPLRFDRSSDADSFVIERPGILLIDFHEGQPGAPPASRGDTVAINWSAHLLGGYRLLDTREPDPLTGGYAQFTRALESANGMPAGWNQAVLGMREGQKRRVVCPPYLIEPETGGSATKLPQSAWVIFDLDMVSVKDKTPDEPTIIPGG